MSGTTAEMAEILEMHGAISSEGRYSGNTGVTSKDNAERNISNENPSGTSITREHGS